MSVAYQAQQVLEGDRLQEEDEESSHQGESWLRAEPHGGALIVLALRRLRGTSTSGDRGARAGTTCSRRRRAGWVLAGRKAHRRCARDGHLDSGTGPIDIRACKRGAQATRRDLHTLTRERLIVTCTGLEDAVFCVGGGVEATALRVIDVFAKLVIVSTPWVACLETEHVVAVEIVPFHDLNVGPCERLRI